MTTLLADKDRNAALRKSLLDDLEVKTADGERIAAAFPVDEKGRFSIPTEMHRDFTAASKAAEEIKSVLAALDAQDRHRNYLDAPEGPSEAAVDAALRGIASVSGMEGKSLGEMFSESDAYQDFMKRRGGTTQNMEAGDRIAFNLEGKSIFNFTAGTVTHQSLGTAQHVGIAEIARRKMHIRDLFPKSSTKAPILWGVRETGWVNNAAQVKQRYAADGVSPATGSTTDVYGKAPESRLLLTTVAYPVAEIAHILKAHKNILDDEPRLRTFINTRMQEGVKYREDYDLLHSVGDNAERLNGLFNTPGVQEYEGLSADKYSVQVRRAITKALLAEYDPTGLVVSPTMWEQVEVEEDDTGAFRVATSVAIGATKQVWRLNVVETTAMDDGKFLIGAFGMGAQIHDRETVKVMASSEDSDNFQRGIITFRAEERLALEVPRPESFVIGSWTVPGSTP